MFALPSKKIIFSSAYCIYKFKYLSIEWEWDAPKITGVEGFVVLYQCSKVMQLLVLHQCTAATPSTPGFW
jgi:hypothetical protein